MGLRVVCVFGSQTQTCQRLMMKMSDHFRQIKGVQCVDLFEGNALAHELEDLAGLKEAYDAIIVCTSSFGDGEPPDNYSQFLLKLLQAAEDGMKPLAGMQHTVLGEGSSIYRETFQNCPRLSDLYLEQCGSRRFFPRHETDVGGEEGEAISRNIFRDGVSALLQSGLPSVSSPAAAEWAKPRSSHGEPTDQIKVKSADELGGERQQTWAQIIVPFTVAVVAASSFIYTQYVME